MAHKKSNIITNKLDKSGKLGESMGNGKWKSKWGIILGCTLLLSSCGAKEHSAARKEKDATVTAFIQQSVTTDSGTWSGWAANKLYEDTNITVEFYPTGSFVEEKLKQYMASGTIPDIIGFRGLDQAKLFIDADLLLPLNVYEEILPSLFQTPEYRYAIDYSQENMSNDNGDFLLMPVSIGPMSPGNHNWLPMLQWQPYKKAGMPKIETLEDYLDVVEAMLQTQPYTETGEKIYGFSLFRDWDEYSALEVAALSFLYGIDTEYVSPLMETNVITKKTTSILEENSFYKRALHFYYEANQRGLLDPDSRYQTFTNLNKKYSEGRIMFSWFSWLTGSYNAEASGHVNHESLPNGYVALPAEDMKIYEAADQTVGRNWYLAINKNSLNIEKACEFLNWLYDPAVEAFLYNGPEGVTWEKDAEGNPYITEDGWNMIENKTEDLMPNNEGSFNDGLAPFNSLGLQAAAIRDGHTMSYRYWDSTNQKNRTELDKEVFSFYGTDSLKDYLNENDMFAKSTIAVNMISAVPSELGKKISEIGQIVRSISWDMVYAKDEAEFEQLWEGMVEKAKECGMEEVITYYETEWKEALKIAQKYE